MSTTTDHEPTASLARPGRRRNTSLDDAILDATLAVLAEQGYDRTTIDLVAAEAGTVRATVYRRWPTKAELVLAAVERMSTADIPLDRLPDTGTLRGDLVATILAFDDREQEIRMRAVTGLLSLARSEERLSRAAAEASIGPWIEASRLLMRRAVDRGEFPPADVDLISQVIPLMCVGRSLQHLPITREWSIDLIDRVILPALRGA